MTGEDVPLSENLESDGEGPQIDPDVTVIEVRGEKQVGLKGLKHIGMSESDKDHIHDVYDNIIIALDDVKDEFRGVDRAWHIGRVMEEYGVRENDEMTLEELGAFNTIDDMYTRRLFYARYIYEFWPDQQYDPRHSVSALGELASRALNGGWETEVKAGYKRILDHDEELGKLDVLAWYRLYTEYDDPSVEEIVAEVSEPFEKTESVVAAVKRVMLLLGMSLNSIPKNELKAAIAEHSS